MTDTLESVRDRLATLLDRLNTLDHPGDYLVTDCLDADREGDSVARFDVVRMDDDGVERIYRTEIKALYYNQAVKA